MVQFEMYFTNEYIEEILGDLTNVMLLDFSKKDMEKSMQERDTQSKNNVLLIKKEHRFICIDCNDRDWIFPLIVRCDADEALRVKEVMMKWDNLIREEYGQELTNDIHNVYDEDENLLKHIEKYYNMMLGSKAPL